LLLQYGLVQKGAGNNVLWYKIMMWEEQSVPFTPVAGPIFETKNPKIVLVFLMNSRDEASRSLKITAKSLEDAHMAKMTHGEIWNGKVWILGVPALLTVFLVCADMFVMCAERVCCFLLKTWMTQWASHSTQMKKSWHTYCECHICYSYMNMNALWRTYGRIMFHMNESCHTCECVTSYVLFCAGR